MKLLFVLAISLQLLLASRPCFAADEVFITNFPEKVITQDVNSIPNTALRKIENVEVGTFTSMEVIDLLSLIHISEPTRQPATSRMPSSA